MAIRVGDIRRFVVLKKEHFKTVQRKKEFSELRTSFEGEESTLLCS